MRSGRANQDSETNYVYKSKCVLIIHSFIIAYAILVYSRTRGRHGDWKIKHFAKVSQQTWLIRYSIMHEIMKS